MANFRIGSARSRNLRFERAACTPAAHGERGGTAPRLAAQAALQLCARLHVCGLWQSASLARALLSAADLDWRRSVYGRTRALAATRSCASTSRQISGASRGACIGRCRAVRLCISV